MGSFPPAPSLLSFPAFCPNTEQTAGAAAGMELLEVGQGWGVQAPWAGLRTDSREWGFPGRNSRCSQQRHSWGLRRNPCGLQSPGSDSLGSQGLCSCRPGFLCCWTLPRNFSLSLYLWPLPPTRSLPSSHTSSVSGRTFIHLIPGDGFCLFKNTSLLLFPCKGSHAGAHLCFPHASTGPFTTLNPGENWESWV